MSKSSGRSLSADYLKRSQRALKVDKVDEDGLVEPAEDKYSSHRSQKQNRMFNSNLKHSNSPIQNLQRPALPQEKMQILSVRPSTSPSPRQIAMGHQHSRKEAPHHPAVRPESQGYPLSKQIKPPVENRNHDLISNRLSSRPVAPNLTSASLHHYQNIQENSATTPSNPSSSSSQPSRRIMTIPQSRSSPTEPRQAAQDHHMTGKSSNYQPSGWVVSPIEQIRTQSPSFSPELLSNKRATQSREAMKDSVSRNNSKNNPKEQQQNLTRRFTVEEILKPQSVPTLETDAIDMTDEVDLPSVNTLVGKFYHSLQSRANRRIQLFQKRLEEERWNQPL
jgi:hypothetical protein